jgi:hypothetical protein
MVFQMKDFVHLLFHNRSNLKLLFKGTLVIEAMQHWSQGSLQSPKQNVKKWAFWRNFGGLLNFFVWMVAEAF